jgi:outer membrane protein assembly factor BamA
MAGGVLDLRDTLEAARVSEGGEVTAPSLPDIAERIKGFYARHGFTAARVTVDTADTDDPMGVILSIVVSPGAPRMITQRVFVIDPRSDREVGELKKRYRLGAGARVDDQALADADHEMAELLHQNGFYRAGVRHALKHVGPRSYLYVYLETGPRLVPVFDGNRAFDRDALAEALALEKATDLKPNELATRLQQFYVERGFLDAEITVDERGGPGDPVHWVVFTIREHTQVRVTRRVFPCLTGEFSADRIGGEIESFLDEELPGTDALSLGHPSSVDAALGPQQTGRRAQPVELSPEATYAPDVYDRALKHVRDLVHSKGYLNAVVGPVVVLRATCSSRSPPGECIPLPPPRKLVPRCAKDELGLPVAEPDVPEGFTCHPDPVRHIECAPEITLRIPIALGPPTTLYDLAFEGNRAMSERKLAKVAELSLGEPLSNVELEAARLRVLEEYKNLGYAYIEVRTAIEPSPDRTRARARFVISERERVFVSGFVVKGATRTDVDLILGRVALRKGRPYSQEDARLSEERIGTLGTFSSVSLGLEDPDVPQRQKRVVITVVEQLPQYLDPRIGFSTGEGIRFAFEYGHRNIAGAAVQLTLRVQLSYLFAFMILDEDVRRNLEPLPVSQRLERRNTVTLTFPEVGLGPLISLSLEGVDVRDNQRDFGLTKQAVGPTLSYRPRRQITTQLGGSVELNDVQIFNAETVEEAIRKNHSLANLLRVPDGRTFAIAQRLGASWDRRDNPFAATKGTLVAAAIEHVNAFPAELTGTTATITSHFLKSTSRLAGYIRFTKKGTSLALSLSGGYNFQLNSESKTYPDRLFFLGGVDSLRAFLADSVVPEDVAQKILHPDVNSPLTIEDIAIRGGDIYINPRAELRIPLNDTFQIGLFLDTGNLWVDPAAANPFILRYAAGAGLRITTPVGPIALDYGINLERRPWEDFGAFHFSIGLF